MLKVNWFKIWVKVHATRNKSARARISSEAIPTMEIDYFRQKF